MIECIVHSFLLSDVDDVDLYAAEPIYKFQQTEKGKWVMEHGTDTSWNRSLDFNSLGYRYTIHTKFKEEDYTYFKLKYE